LRPSASPLSFISYFLCALSAQNLVTVNFRYRFLPLRPRESILFRNPNWPYNVLKYPTQMICLTL
jgi:hypothetical protein